SNRSLLGKAALKTHALQTLTRGPLTRPRAKRLERVRFIGAFPLARNGQWFMVPMHSHTPEEALHEPPFRPRPRPRSHRLVSRTRTSRRTIRFKVPMHGTKDEEALNE